MKVLPFPSTSKDVSNEKPTCITTWINDWNEEEIQKGKPKPKGNTYRDERISKKRKEEKDTFLKKGTESKNVM
jgi:hypothetical protein